MTRDINMPWQMLLLGIISDRNEATLQNIYIDTKKAFYSLKKEGCQLLIEKLFESDPRNGNRPKYQHTILDNLSRYKKSGLIEQPGKGIYRITSAGKDRLKELQEGKIFRGGKQPGAGAPRGNLNDLKNGLKSRQLRDAFTGSVEDWQSFLARLKDDRQRTRAKVAAVLWLIACENKTRSKTFR